MKTTLRLAVPVALAFAVAALAGCVTSTPLRGGSDVEAARYNTQLAAAYLQRGDVALAMEKVDKALEQNDDFAQAHLVKGMILARAEEYDDADDYYLRAARLAPRDVAVQSNVAAYLCRRERRRDGEELFLKVAQMPTYARPAIALTNAGLCARRIPELERAEAHFRRALELEPNYAPALSNMAEVSYERAEMLAARAFLQRLESVQPLGPEGLWLGVRVERDLGDAAAEQRYADILLRDFPKSAEAQTFLNERNSGKSDANGG